MSEGACRHALSSWAHLLHALQRLSCVFPRLHPAFPCPCLRLCAFPLPCSESLVVGNTVNPALQGVGGGLFLGRDGFSVALTQLEGNRAHYGGGLFISADLSRNAALAYLNMSGNTAAMGSAIFWCARCTVHCTARCTAGLPALGLPSACCQLPVQSLSSACHVSHPHPTPPAPAASVLTFRPPFMCRTRSKSPNATLECETCLVAPQNQDAMATEPLAMQYGEQACRQYTVAAMQHSSESRDKRQQRLCTC